MIAKIGVELVSLEASQSGASFVILGVTFGFTMQFYFVLCGCFGSFIMGECQESHEHQRNFRGVCPNSPHANFGGGG